MVLDLCRNILNAAQVAGAQAIVAGCPMCQANLDTRETEIETRFGEKYNLPILYFSQLLGLAVGVPEEGLGLWRHVVEPKWLKLQFDIPASASGVRAIIKIKPRLWNNEFGEFVLDQKEVAW